SKSNSIVLNVVVFFFSSRRRHTRFSRDWSSDVCSSDLAADRHSQQRHEMLHCWRAHSATSGAHHHVPESNRLVFPVISHRSRRVPVNGLSHIVPHSDKQILPRQCPEFPSTDVRSSSSRTCRPVLHFRYRPYKLWHHQSS